MKNLPGHSLSAGFLYWLAAAMAITLVAGQAQIIDSRHRISVLSEETTQADRDLLRQAVDCEEQIRRFVGRHSPMLTLYLLPGQERRDFRPGMFFHGIDMTLDPLVREHQLTRILLYRLALELNTRQRTLPPEAIPDWLIAAMHHHILHRDDPRTIRGTFSSVRLLAQGKQLPPWQALVDQPCLPQLPVLYQLYSQSSACLLRLLQQQDASLVRHVLGNLNPQQPDSVTLAMFFPETLGSETGQQWFEHNVTRIAYRIDQPGSYKMVQDALNKIEHVTIMVPGDAGAFTIRKVLIEDVPNYLDRYDYSRYNVTGMIKDLFLLMQNCPHPLRESLIGYVEALDLLRQGRYQAFSQRIKAARQTFNTAYVFGQNARQYLIEQEQLRHSAARRLFAFERDQLLPDYTTDYERSIQAWLDDMERKYSPAPRQTELTIKREVE